MLAILGLGLLPIRAQAQALPSGWSTSDIGQPQIAGSATYASAKFTVTGAGTDIWNGNDQFRFVYRQLTGDGVIVARVDSLQQAHEWSKAGVMIRETLATGSKNAFTLASAAKGLSFQRRIATSSASVSTIVAGAPPRWVKVERKGAVFTSSVSTNGTTWQTIGSQSITMAATVYAGLAVTSHNPAQKVSATFSSVAVTPATTTPPPANQPPTVAIAAPAAGSTVSGSVTIRGTASDDAGVSKVEVRVDAGAYALATGTTSWTTTLNSSSVSDGAHTLTARATDTAGLTTTTVCLGDCVECTGAWNHGGRSHPHRLSGPGRGGPVRGHGRDLDAQQRRALGRALPVLRAGLVEQLGLESRRTDPGVSATCASRHRRATCRWSSTT